MSSTTATASIAFAGSSALPSTSTAAAASPPQQQQQRQQQQTRMERTTVCLPIVYGSIAFSLGKKADDYQTHQWTLYVRGGSGSTDDLSHAISKVIFQLHASFAQPVRELTAPPYEVTERGWGEFEAHIRILWKDPQEKATLLTHFIQLYPPGMPAHGTLSNLDPNVPVVAESYDEVVFTDPAESFFRSLMRVRDGPPLPPDTYSPHQYFQTNSDTADLQALLEASRYLQTAVQQAKERLIQVDAELMQVEDALKEAQEQRKQQQLQQQQQQQQQAHQPPTQQHAAAGTAGTAPATAAPPRSGNGGKGSTSINPKTGRSNNNSTGGGGPASKKAKTATSASSSSSTSLSAAALAANVAAKAAPSTTTTTTTAAAAGLEAAPTSTTAAGAVPASKIMSTTKPPN